jgi:glutathione S-transferase
MPGFAPPFLIDGDLELAQMPAICAYLGERHGLAPDDAGLRVRALQLQLTVADAVNEVHDTHHPVGSALYFEDQHDEAVRAARSFRNDRLPKWLGFFDKVIEASGGPFVFGADASYVDLALFQLVEGLRFAFPNTMAATEGAAPRLIALADRIPKRDRLAAYLASDRRLDFNEHGIFRHYPELDTPDDA